MSDALKILADKNLLPTNLTTGEIRELDAALRNQSFFSAQTTNEYLLQRYQDLLANLLEPDRLKAYTPAFPGDTLSRSKYDPAYVREEIKKFLQGVGYSPKDGEAGTLKDLSSDARINLIIKTNTELAQGQGWWVANQNPVILDEWPAQELFRAEERAKKRDWLARWRQAGEQTDDPIGTGWTITPDLRLIALKNHDIWNWIGSSELFDDALDVMWPPFAFNSGMWVRDVDRTETEAIGLLKKGEAAPQPLDVTAALKNFSAKLSALEVPA